MKKLGMSPKRRVISQCNGPRLARAMANPVRIALTALRDLDNLLGEDFLHDRRLAFGVQGQTGNVIGLAQNLGRLGVESAIPENWYDR